ncbi:MULTISPECIES: hypothetical protein [Photorhabdus]|uniref:Uncharacterized protein n=1 Tax=Photorhabdus khanii subsp. guanajuatensis TaxID=2100166 RepID=A0A4V2X5N4_9GAMM|nr:hypothetical protein [Photorhabdus khanii]TDB48865.1 hypothetical protein C5467_18280 [Photorhabdus khanii subsp. guanajuatensis]
MQGNVQKRMISWVEIHDLFAVISDEIGFIVENYEDELADLIDIWAQQGYIEIYTSSADCRYGRAKDSNSVPGSSPWYIGLFHVRVVEAENDPLIVLVFEERGENTIASIRFMLDHEDMFGPKNRRIKFDRDAMKRIRRCIDEFIQRGNTADFATTPQ